MPEVENNVVLRFRDGRAERCRLSRPFSPRDDSVDVVSAEDGSPSSVSVYDLKAVFFLKDRHRRNADFEDEGGATQGRGAPLAKVEFFDGEIMRGRVEHYSTENTGFFLYPTARESNNEQVFVVARALHTVSLDG